MRQRLDPFSFLVISVAGWINERQQQVIDYLVEENVFCANRSVTAVCVSLMTSAVGWQ
jgi:hypothetical protein